MAELLPLFDKGNLKKEKSVLLDAVPTLLGK